MDEHPDLRPIGFTIHETHRDMWLFGQRYIRPSDDADWELCPDCKGLPHCFSGDRYGDRYKHCTESQCFCLVVDKKDAKWPDDPGFAERVKRMEVTRFIVSGRFEGKD